MILRLVGKIDSLGKFHVRRKLGKVQGASTLVNVS
jgi:hypothetical protein